MHLPCDFISGNWASIPFAKGKEKSMDSGSYQVEIELSIGLLVERLRERRRWADAITDATFDSDVKQFEQIDRAVNTQFERMTATLARHWQGEG
jgi:hypothetical protein